MGSVGVHGAVVVLAVLSSMAERAPVEFISYQIELVSPPPAMQAAESAPAREELVVERPEPTPPAPEEEKPIVEEEKPKPKPAETKPAPRQEPPKETGEERSPAVTDVPVPEETPRESGEGINVRLEGVRRDYPAYYNNIITQIQRCLRWRNGGSWETTVYFLIKRDGSVSDLDFVKRSGNAAFDVEAMGAVECAGKGRFGSLPEELPFEVLPVQFNFRPQGGVRGTFPEGPQTTRGEATGRR
jgi:outer membrane biosynthesis protein TonB